jgi:hypothetical protein
VCPNHQQRARRKLLSRHSKISPKALSSEIHALSSSNPTNNYSCQTTRKINAEDAEKSQFCLPFIQTFNKSMTRPVEVSLARCRRRSARSCSSDLMFLLSRCASFASFTDVCVTSEPNLPSFAFNSSTSPGIRLRVAIFMAVVISVFFSKAVEAEAYVREYV